MRARRYEQQQQSAKEGRWHKWWSLGGPLDLAFTDSCCPRPETRRTEKMGDLFDMMGDLRNAGQPPRAGHSFHAHEHTLQEISAAHPLTTLEREGGRGAGERERRRKRASALAAMEVRAALLILLAR